MDRLFCHAIEAILNCKTDLHGRINHNHCFCNGYSQNETNVPEISVSSVYNFFPLLRSFPISNVTTITIF
jgi:hypothetical protein